MTNERAMPGLEQGMLRQEHGPGKKNERKGLGWVLFTLEMKRFTEVTNGD